MDGAITIKHWIYWKPTSKCFNIFFKVISNSISIFNIFISFLYFFNVVDHNYKLQLNANFIRKCHSKGWEFSLNSFRFLWK